MWWLERWGTCEIEKNVQFQYQCQILRSKYKAWYFLLLKKMSKFNQFYHKRSTFGYVSKGVCWADGQSFEYIKPKNTLRFDVYFEINVDNGINKNSKLRSWRIFSHDTVWLSTTFRRFFLLLFFVLLLPIRAQRFILYLGR